MTNWGQAIRKWRTARGMSQEDVAAAIGYSRSQISRWESNGDQPSVGDAVLIAAKLGVTVNQMFNGEAAHGVQPVAPAQPPESEDTNDSAQESELGGARLAR